MASGPITSWQIDRETVADFIFLGSKITADSDCSHEMKRRLLPGRMRVQSLSQEDCLEKGMATCSSILTWGIPGTEEHGGLQFLGLQSRIRLSTHTLQNGALFPHRDGGERNIYRKERCRLFRDLFPLVCHQRSPSCHLLLHLSGVRALVQMFSGLVREEHFFEKIGRAHV